MGIITMTQRRHGDRNPLYLLPQMKTSAPWIAALRGIRAQAPQFPPTHFFPHWR